MNLDLTEHAVQIDGWGAPEDLEPPCELHHDAVLDPAIDEEDPREGPPRIIHSARVDDDRRPDRHLRNEVGAIRWGQSLQSACEMRFLLNGTEDCQERSVLTDPPCDGPCIDALDPRHAMASEQFIDGPDGEPMIGVLHRMANDHGPGPDPTGFGSAPMDAIISDQRVGEGEDLTREGWVREGLLIPCHVGAEDEFTLCRADRPEELTLEPAAVSEQEHPWPLRPVRNRRA